MHIDHVHGSGCLLRVAIIPKQKTVYKYFTYTIHIGIKGP